MTSSRASIGDRLREARLNKQMEIEYARTFSARDEATMRQIAELAIKHNLAVVSDEAYEHVIFDGRSTEPGSAPALLDMLEKKMAEIGIGQVVTGIGRGIALDRDGNYGRIKTAYQAMVNGTGRPCPCG